MILTSADLAQVRYIPCNTHYEVVRASERTAPTPANPPKDGFWKCLCVEVRGGWLISVNGECWRVPQAFTEEQMRDMGRL